MICNDKIKFITEAEHVHSSSDISVRRVRRTENARLGMDAEGFEADGVLSNLCATSSRRVGSGDGEEPPVNSDLVVR